MVLRGRKHSLTCCKRYLRWQEIRLGLGSNYWPILVLNTFYFLPRPLVLAEQGWNWQCAESTSINNLTAALVNSATTEWMSKIWGSSGGIKLIKWFEFEERCDKIHACIVVYRMARHNHLIDWYYLLSSLVKLMVTESRRASLKYLHSCVWQNIPPEKSWISDIYSVVTL